MTDLSPEQVQAIRSRARCLYSQPQIELALERMAAAIGSRLRERNPILLCVMNGGLVVSAQLALRLDFPLQIDYIHASRYRAGADPAGLRWKAHPSLPMEGRSVLVVDDILDEGITLQQVVAWCRERGAAEVLVAVLVDKQHDRRRVAIQADYVGLEVEDCYVAGYGMDYRGYLRNAAGIFALDQADLSQLQQTGAGRRRTSPGPGSQ